MKLKSILFIGLLSAVFFVIGSQIHLTKAIASSFISSQGITKVTMKVLPCEKYETEESSGKKKCQDKKDDLYAKSAPIVITKDDLVISDNQSFLDRVIGFARTVLSPLISF
ncbi:MAG: hypothetical protein COU27_01160 [Candidatus Levybacteria bacterium CG10_big_fil_rev_8_21_14_0_10_36_7]|nr:MAG: hypothetical protein COU27_01160 [Candidatus Levybacteria bacterium CG10_big_fil_rev_8_21_14_0_10_36_7]